MTDLVTVTSALTALLAQGGSDAAVELSKNAVLKGAEVLSNLWRELFSHEPKIYPLAHEAAGQPDNTDLQNQLQALVQQTLSAHPELIPSMKIILAERGSIAAETISGGTITIHNAFN